MLDPSLANQTSLPLDHAPNSENWYVAETKPGKYLQATRELHEQEFHTFCPLIASTELVRLPRNGRGSSGRTEKTTTRPLFTNYLFVRIDILVQPWQRINNTRGVRKLLTGAQSRTDENNDPVEQLPLPVKPKVIEFLLKNPIFYTNPGPYLGQRVKLLTPILQGELGTIIQVSKLSIEVLLDATRYSIRAKRDEVAIEAPAHQRALQGS